MTNWKFEIRRQLRLAKRRGSNPYSAILRMLVDKFHYKNFVGSQLVAMSLIVSSLALPTHAFEYGSRRPQFVDGSVFVPVTTETTYLLPVVKPIGVSQGFGRFHPAVDIRAPRGSEIVAISDGVVVESSYVASGYGRYVRIAHEGNILSLSAHMDSSLVKAGDKVSKGQVVGTVGMTGWTTGPHLHFEVSQDGVYVDPMSVVR